LEKILKVLVFLGFLRHEKGRYINTPIAQEFLRRGSPLYQGDLIRLQAAYYDVWSNLTKAVTGVWKPEPPKRGENTFNKMFTYAMAEAALRGSLHRVVEAVVRNIPELSKARRMLDLGGGHGLYAVAFTQIFPKLKVDVYDLPPVVDVAKEFTSRWRVGSRVNFVAGDFTKQGLGKNLYDVVFASHVLYRKDYNRKLLKKIFTSLKPKGLLISSHWMEGKTENLASILWNLNMLLLGYTKTTALYSEEEFCKLLRETGFTVLRIFTAVEEYDPVTIVVARKIEE
jgi:ubiquinone/menaquinone biosynthesis C-methylase UbiE